MNYYLFDCFYHYKCQHCNLAVRRKFDDRCSSAWMHNISFLVEYIFSFWLRWLTSGGFEVFRQLNLADKFSWRLLMNFDGKFTDWVLVSVLNWWMFKQWCVCCLVSVDSDAAWLCTFFCPFIIATASICVCE